MERLDVRYWLYFLGDCPDKSRWEGDRWTPPFTQISVEGLDPIIYDPYPSYNSPQWLEKNARHVDCKGPRRVNVTGNADEMILAHKLLGGKDMLRRYLALLIASSPYEASARFS